MSKILPDPNYPETPIYGMNSYDSDKIMSGDAFRGFYRRLVNTYPGVSQKPRKGTKDVCFSAALLGFNNTRTVFKSKPAYLSADGKDYVFVWSQSIDYRTEFNLEMWNLTDNTREILESGTFENENVYFSMVKIYNAIYCTSNYLMSNNHTSQYRTINKIIEYVNGEFIVRSMGIDESPIIQDRYIVESSADNVFEARHLAGSAVFNSKLWLLGGADGSRVFQSVHSSSDGKFWTTHTVTALEYVLDESGNHILDESGNSIVTEATFVKRQNFGTVVFNNRLWIFGGVDDAGNRLNDAWYTEDGATWYLHDRSAEWSARYGFATVVHSGRVYLTGGIDTVAKNDVWYTTDFTTWTQVTVSTAFTARYGHTMLSYNGYMWIFIGHSVTNVYRSSDGGVNWTQVTADATLGQREYHSSLVFENKMWVIGGNAGGTRQANVYNTTDGNTWNAVDSTTDWSARSGLCAQVFLSKIFVYCGYSGSVYYNDVWTSGTGAAWVPESSGLTKQKYYSYAATFVRRSDSLSKLASIDDYDYQAWETYNGQTIVGVDEVLLLGTVSLSGNNLTGSGTDFTQLSSGQNIRIDGTPYYYQLTSITNATTAAVSNTDGESYTSKEFALMPSVGNTISIDQYEDADTESIENVDYRTVVFNYSTTDNARIFHHIPFRSYIAARAKGATHVRIYRTLNGADASTAQGLDHRFLIDVAINVIDNVPSGKYEYKVFRDGVTDDILEGESNLLMVTGLETPPLGRFCMWAAGSLWIGGNTATNGMWYRSEFPTGKNPKKWSQFFNTTSNYAACDPDDGQKDTGCVSYGGDLYFFKERKIFRLPNSDIENDVVNVSTSMGCICPDSICTAEVPVLGGACVFFLSEIGPGVILPGGTVRLLNEFKIAELYFDADGIVNNSVGIPTDSYTRNKVQAEYYNNSYIVTLGDSEDSNCGISTNKVFGINFDIDAKSYGAFQVVYGVHQTSGVVFEPTALVKIGSFLLGLSHKRFGNTNAYRVAKLEDRSIQRDSFLGGVGDLPYSMIVDSRHIPVGPYRNSDGQARKWRAYIDFNDSEAITISVNGQYGKFVTRHEVTMIRQEGIVSAQSTTYRDYIAGIIKESVPGKVFNICIEKVVPAIGGVEYSGYMIEVEDVERENSDEWICEGLSVISDKTFTVNANDTVEVDAYEE